MACVDVIHVYQPTFPNQWLSDTPDIVLKLPVTQPGLSGTLDPSAPHAVNNLLVDFLGNSEILLVSCDDGDIIGFRTGEVQEAIERRQDPDYVEGGVGDDVRAFFHENVSRSAWGLAVHQEARMIAVSANTHKVTVFAFALAGPQAETTSVQLIGDDPDATFRFSRHQDCRIVLEGTGFNIPSVAFCNTGDDPTGRWLLSSDIAGRTYLWDVHGQMLIKVIDAGFCVKDEGRCNCQDRMYYNHAAWASLWLDRRSFRKTASIPEALGCRTIPDSQYVQNAVWNISTSRSDVVNASDVYKSTPITPATATLGTFQSASVSEAVDVGEPMEGDTDEEDSPLPTVPRYYNIEGKQPFVNIKAHTLRKDAYAVIPKCPILQVTVKDVLLLQPHHDAENTHAPAIAMYDPLFQDVPEETGPFSNDMLDYSDRMNMRAVIPELGVVVIASPKGRAAVFSLTQTRALGRVVYAFRLDHILPFHSQEVQRQRPEVLLLGVAVGPVQGRLGTAYAKRWRLLMTYSDHSVLSYEIGKYRERDQGAQMLVV